MKKLLIVLLMAITLFAVASTPADNGTNTTNPTVVTPPSNMIAGMLVVLHARSQASSGTLAISATGGQTWYSGTQQNQTDCRVNVFWCIFNGNWSANPSVTMAGTTNNAARMMVFSPTIGYSFSTTLDCTEGANVFAAPAGPPYDVTIPAVTTGTNGSVVLALWANTDDTTWGSLAGSIYTWIAFSPAQVRNTSGVTDGSMTGAYQVQASAGISGTVTQAQTANGPDAGAYHMLAFKEIRNTGINVWQKAPDTTLPNSTASGTSLTTTAFAASVTEGHIIIAYCTQFSSADVPTQPTFSDSKGNVWYVDKTQTYNAGGTNNGRTTIAHCIVAAGKGGTAFTVTVNTSTSSIELGAVEAEGVDTALVAGGSGSNSATGVSNAPSSGAVAVSGNHIYLGCAVHFAANVATQASGWLVRHKDDTISSATMAEEDLCSSGSQTATWALVSSDTWAAACVAYKEPTGGVLNTPRAMHHNRQMWA